MILEKKLGHYACVKFKIVTDVNAWLVPYYESCRCFFLQNATDEQNIAAKNNIIILDISKNIA
jgi:hypothetical protein